MSGFTMPGETGHEDWVLDLAERWGADALRDSDGTRLPDKIKQAGYPIYSTLCLIRGDNAFAKQNRDKLQQMLLVTKPVQASSDRLSIELLADVPKDAYEINASPQSLSHWQVFDRTTGGELPRARWFFSPQPGTVEITGATPWHRYTVTFFAYEIWEFVSRYNHQTNHWTAEHEMPLDPIYPEVRARMLERLDTWLKQNSHTSVVRFTTFFYFSGLGGWGDYGRTVSPRALEGFSEKFGYTPAAETFVNGGIYNPAYLPPAKEYRDWMAFMSDFVLETIKPFIDKVRKAGKKAVFLLGDHWIGSEPGGERFSRLGMDGVVKSVFNGFEARICAAIESAPIKEIRFHPYFFPREVTGKPTFSEGGTPTADLKTYWRDIRRACLRVRIHRIGFGGYPSLLKNHPDFVDHVAEVSQQAAMISDLHGKSRVWTAPIHVGVLNGWGKSRAWMCCGHMSHNSMYNHLLESLAGLPIHVDFLSFDDILRHGIPASLDILVNGGRMNTAWSGGGAWRNPVMTETISAFVASGKGFIGIGEPSACKGMDVCFQLAHVLGIDREAIPGECNNTYQNRMEKDHFITQDLSGEAEFIASVPNLQLKSNDSKIVAWAKSGDCDYYYNYIQPQITVNTFGKGRAVYFSGFKYNATNNRLLGRSLFWAAGKEALFDTWRCTNLHTECAYFSDTKTLVVVNNSHEPQKTGVYLEDGATVDFDLKPLDCLRHSIG